MTYRSNISISILRLSVSLLMLWAVVPGLRAQKIFRMEKDSVAFFRGFSLSFDLVGPAMLMLSDHGEYEGALRVNLHDQWFPIVEAGIGKANHEDDVVTGLTYKTTAPYFRLGMDWNILKKKHGPNRMYAGLRYAFTSYSLDIIRENLPDPVWQSDAGFGIRDMRCKMHWLEVVFGIDAKVVGPFHLGWGVRYKRPIYHDEGGIGSPWYVPGFGTGKDDQLTANFNFIIDI